MFPVESTINPIVENTVLACQLTAADALGVIVTAGGVSGG